MFGSGQEDFSDVRECWEDLPNVRKWSGHPPGCLGVIGSPSLMSLNGREFIPDVWERSGGPHRCPGLVGIPSGMSGSGREALPNVRDWSGDPPGFP